MEPIPGYHTEDPQPIHHEENPQPAGQNGAKLDEFGNEIEGGVTELAGGVGQAALGIAAWFAPLFGVNPEHPQDQTDGEQPPPSQTNV